MTTETRTAMQTAETVIRGIMRTFPEKPIRASFYRGMRNTIAGVRADEEIVETPAAADGWYVNLNPGLGDVAICAIKPSLLGWDIIGGKPADCLSYPRISGDVVDVKALAGIDFGCQLMDAIDEKIAAIREARRG